MFAKSHAALRAHLSWCKVFSFDLSSKFGAQRLRSWSAHFWIIPRDGPFLSRILIWCQVPLENLTACLFPIFQVHVEQIFSDKNLEIHNPIVWTPSIKQLIFLYHLSLTSCWALLLPQRVGSGTCRHVHIHFQTCNSDTREGGRF